MIKSKLTRKARTTIPLPLQTALRLSEGDELGYTIDGERVILLKAERPSPVDDPFATFTEWSSEADRAGFGDLLIVRILADVP